MPNLNTLDSIQQNFFIELNIPTQGTLRLSDYHIDFTVDGNSYNALGSLLNITTTKTEIRASSQTLTVTISGLPTANMNMVKNLNIKGSTVTVHRAFFDIATGNLLSLDITNPLKRFEGIVNNFTIQESWNQDKGESSFAIAFQVQNLLGQLLKRTNGRRTNPVDQEKISSGDLSFNRVPDIRNSNFNFGAPDIVPRLGTK